MDASSGRDYWHFESGVAWRIREWIYLCALDQMPAETLEKMPTWELEKIQRERMEFLQKKFQDIDLLERANEKKIRIGWKSWLLIVSV